MTKKPIDRAEILDTLRQCERALADMGTDPDALHNVRAAIDDMEGENHDGVGIFARDFIPR